MKRLLFAMIALLAACGGGGGGGGSVPPGSPGGSSGKSIHFTANSTGPQSVGQRVGAWKSAASGCSATPPPVVLQSTANFNPQGGNWSVSWDMLTATEYDTSCLAVSGAATYTVDNPQVAVLAAPVFPARPTEPTPAPGTSYVSGGVPGKATVTAHLPDGTSASLDVHVYARIGLTCDSNASSYLGYAFGASQYSADGWNDTQGSIFDACFGHSYSPEPTFDAQVTSSNAITFPAGYEIQNSNAALSDFIAVTSCAPFASQGTTLISSSTPTSNSYPATNFILLFKTHDGLCIKAYMTPVTAPGSLPLTLTGLYAISDAGGSFSY